MRLQPVYALIINAIFCGLQITALVLLWQMDRSSPDAPNSWLTARNDLPSPETAARLFRALMASGHITMRRVDGWQRLDQAPAQQTLDLAA